MYGLIHQGLKDMVCFSFGDQVWREICEQANRTSVDFDPLRPYPDSETLEIIDVTAKRLNISVEQVLHRFGHYWIKYTAAEGYGPILDLLGQSFRSCVSNLNRMHGHMGVMMPNLQPPRFTVDEHNRDHITVHYHSTRVGLAPMVLGLLEGLSERFEEPVAIEYIPKGTRSNHDEFDVFFRPAATGAK